MTVASSRFRRLRWREIGALLVLGGCAVPVALPAAAQSSSSTYSLSGVITLEGLAPTAPAQTVALFLFPASGASPLMKTAQVDATGAYQIDGIPSDVYTVWIKADYYLAFEQSNVNLTASDQLLSALLPAGDTNNDNSVDSSDFGNLFGSYGSDIHIPGSGYDPSVDLNYDGKVDSTDFSLLINNYNSTGPTAPPTIIPGKWQSEYHWQGVLTANWRLTDGSTWQKDIAWDDDGSNASTNDGNRLPIDYKGSLDLGVVGASYSTAGTVTVIYTWIANLDGYDVFHPSPPNPQPGPVPQTLTLLEKPYALAHQEPNTIAAANDGMGDPAVLSDSVLTSQSVGHLTSHEVVNNQVTITHSMSAQTNLTFAWDAQDVLLSYSAIEDSRSAIITCPAVENPANYYKDSGSNTFPFTPSFQGRNTRNGDGSMTVDTVVRAVVGPRYNPVDWGFQAHLLLSASGFDLNSTNWFGGALTNTTTTWTVGTPDWFVDDITAQGVALLRQGTKSEIANSPVVIPVHVTVTDVRPGMEATAANDFTIRVHAPMENLHDLPSKQQFDHDESFKESAQVDAGIANVTVAVEKDPVNCILRDNTITQNAGVIGTFLAGIAGSGSAGLVFAEISDPFAIVADMIFNLFGYALSTYGPPPVATTVSASADYAAFVQAVNDQYNITHNNVTNDNMVCLSENRIISGASIDLIHDDPGKYWLASKHPKAQCHAGVRMNLCTIGGDQYNVNGYVGYHEYTLVVPGPSFLVWQFDLSGTGVPGF